MHNLPVSALLAMVMLYWLLVILGILDNDFEDDGSDVLGLRSTGAGAGVGHDSLGGKKGSFLSFGGVPLSIVGSFMAVFMWVISLLSNFYFNGEAGNRSLIFAAVLMVPNVIISLILTRIAIYPIERLFRAMRESSTESVSILGSEGTVISKEVDEKYGQVEIASKGAPVHINARIMPGEATIKRGAVVTIQQVAADGSYYFVSPVSTLPES